jgi:hypothetical protein
MCSIMKYLPIFLCSMGLLPVLAADSGGRAPHPFIGKWEWTRAENNCTEVYKFRADGVGFVQSGEERSDITFAISDEPDSEGFYKLQLKTVVDFGGKDCADSESNDSGNETTTYVIFDPNKQKHLSCARANLSACFGPLNRVGQ